MLINQPLPGDLLVRRERLYRHIGIFMPGGWVLTNSPSSGEHLTTLQDFQSGKHVDLIRVPNSLRRIAMANARSILAFPKGYDLFFNNCDHTVSRAYGFQPESPQLRAWLGALSSLCALLL